MRSILILNEYYNHHLMQMNPQYLAKQFIIPVYLLFTGCQGSSSFPDSSVENRPPLTQQAGGAASGGNEVGVRSHAAPKKTIYYEDLVVNKYQIGASDRSAPITFSNADSVRSFYNTDLNARYTHWYYGTNQIIFRENTFCDFMIKDTFFTLDHYPELRVGAAFGPNRHELYNNLAYGHTDRSIISIHTVLRETGEIQDVTLVIITYRDTITELEMNNYDY